MPTEPVNPTDPSEDDSLDREPSHVGTDEQAHSKDEEQKEFLRAMLHRAEGQTDMFIEAEAQFKKRLEVVGAEMTPGERRRMDRLAAVVLEERRHLGRLSRGEASDDDALDDVVTRLDTETSTRENNEDDAVSVDDEAWFAAWEDRQREIEEKEAQIEEYHLAAAADQLIPEGIKTTLLDDGEVLPKVVGGASSRTLDDWEEEIADDVSDLVEVITPPPAPVRRAKKPAPESSMPIFDSPEPFNLDAKLDEWDTDARKKDERAAGLAAKPMPSGEMPTWDPPEAVDLGTNIDHWADDAKKKDARVAEFAAKPMPPGEMPDFEAPEPIDLDAKIDAWSTDDGIGERLAPEGERGEEVSGVDVFSSEEEPDAWEATGWRSAPVPRSEARSTDVSLEAVGDSLGSYDVTSPRLEGEDFLRADASGSEIGKSDHEDEERSASSAVWRALQGRSRKMINEAKLRLQGVRESEVSKARFASQREVRSSLRVGKLLGAITDVMAAGEEREEVARDAAAQVAEHVGLPIERVAAIVDQQVNQLRARALQDAQREVSGGIKKTGLRTIGYMALASGLERVIPGLGASVAALRIADVGRQGSRIEKLAEQRLADLRQELHSWEGDASGRVESTAAEQVQNTLADQIARAKQEQIDQSDGLSPFDDQEIDRLEWRVIEDLRRRHPEVTSMTVEEEDAVRRSVYAISSMDIATRQLEQRAIQIRKGPMSALLGTMDRVFGSKWIRGGETTGERTLTAAVFGYAGVVARHIPVVREVLMGYAGAKIGELAVESALKLGGENFDHLLEDTSYGHRLSEGRAMLADAAFRERDPAGYQKLREAVDTGQEHQLLESNAAIDALRQETNAMEDALRSRITSEKGKRVMVNLGRIGGAAVGAIFGQDVVAWVGAQFGSSTGSGHANEAVAGSASAPEVEGGAAGGTQEMSPESVSPKEAPAEVADVHEAHGTPESGARVEAVVPAAEEVPEATGLVPAEAASEEASGAAPAGREEHAVPADDAAPESAPLEEAPEQQPAEAPSEEHEHHVGHAAELDSVDVATPADGLSPQEQEQLVELAQTQRGDGLLRIMRRQLEVQPEHFGFTGDASDKSAVRTWAQKESISVAKHSGFLSEDGDTLRGPRWQGEGESGGFLVEWRPDGSLGVSELDGTRIMRHVPRTSTDVLNAQLEQLRSQDPSTLSKSIDADINGLRHDLARSGSVSGEEALAHFEEAQGKLSVSRAQIEELLRRDAIADEQLFDAARRFGSGDDAAGIELQKLVEAEYPQERELLQLLRGYGTQSEQLEAVHGELEKSGLFDSLRGPEGNAAQATEALVEGDHRFDQGDMSQAAESYQAAMQNLEKNRLELNQILNAEARTPGMSDRLNALVGEYGQQHEFAEGLRQDLVAAGALEGTDAEMATRDAYLKLEAIQEAIDESGFLEGDVKATLDARLASSGAETQAGASSSAPEVVPSTPASSEATEVPVSETASAEGASLRLASGRSLELSFAEGSYTPAQQEQILKHMQNDLDIAEEMKKQAASLRMRVPVEQRVAFDQAVGQEVAKIDAGVQRTAGMANGTIKGTIRVSGTLVEPVDAAKLELQGIRQHVDLASRGPNRGAEDVGRSAGSAFDDLDDAM
jgi:hypothetical protein